MRSTARISAVLLAEKLEEAFRATWSRKVDIVREDCGIAVAIAAPIATCMLVSADVSGDMTIAVTVLITVCASCG